MLKSKSSWLKNLGKKAGTAGVVFSLWEASEKGWTTGASIGFATDLAMVGVGVLCPLCGMGYGAARLIIDVSGYDIADEIDKSVGSDYLKNRVSDFRPITFSK